MVKLRRTAPSSTSSSVSNFRTELPAKVRIGDPMPVHKIVSYKYVACASTNIMHHQTPPLQQNPILTTATYIPMYPFTRMKYDNTVAASQVSALRQTQIPSLNRRGSISSPLHLFPQAVAFCSAIPPLSQWAYPYTHPLQTP